MVYNIYLLTCNFFKCFQLILLRIWFISRFKRLKIISFYNNSRSASTRTLYRWLLRFIPGLSSRLTGSHSCLSCCICIIIRNSSSDIDGFSWGDTTSVVLWIALSDLSSVNCHLRRDSIFCLGSISRANTCTLRSPKRRLLFAYIRIKLVKSNKLLIIFRLVMARHQEEVNSPILYMKQLVLRPIIKSYWWLMLDGILSLSKWGRVFIFELFQVRAYLIIYLNMRWHILSLS